MPKKKDIFSSRLVYYNEIRMKLNLTAQMNLVNETWPNKRTLDKIKQFLMISSYFL